MSVETTLFYYGPPQSAFVDERDIYAMAGEIDAYLKSMTCNDSADTLRFLDRHGETLLDLVERALTHAERAVEYCDTTGMITNQDTKQDTHRELLTVIWVYLSNIVQPLSSVARNLLHNSRISPSELERQVSAHLFAEAWEYTGLLLDPACKLPDTAADTVEIVNILQAAAAMHTRPSSGDIYIRVAIETRIDIATRIAAGADNLPSLYIVNSLSRLESYKDTYEQLMDTCLRTEQHRVVKLIKQGDWCAVFSAFCCHLYRIYNGEVRVAAGKSAAMRATLAHRLHSLQFILLWTDGEHVGICVPSGKSDTRVMWTMWSRKDQMLALIIHVHRKLARTREIHAVAETRDAGPQSNAQELFFI